MPGDWGDEIRPSTWLSKIRVPFLSLLETLFPSDATATIDCLMIRPLLYQLRPAIGRYFYPKSKRFNPEEPIGKRMSLYPVFMTPMSNTGQTFRYNRIQEAGRLQVGHISGGSGRNRDDYNFEESQRRVQFGTCWLVDSLCTRDIRIDPCAISIYFVEKENEQSPRPGRRVMCRGVVGR